MNTLILTAIYASLVSAQTTNIEDEIDAIENAAASYYNAHSTDANLPEVIQSYGYDFASLIETDSIYSSFYPSLTAEVAAITDIAAVKSYVRA